MTYELIQGDCLDVMRTMPDNSVDSVVTDPPYELSSDGKTSPNRVFLEFMFPEHPKLDAALSGENELPILITKVLSLCSVRGFPRPTPAVPIGSVTFDDQSAGRQVDVKHGDESAVSIADSVGRNDMETEGTEYLGSFTFKLTDSTTVTDTLNSAGCCFTTGGLGVGFRISPASLPSLLTNSGVINDSDPIVRLLNDTFSHLVGTGSGTEDLTMPRLDLRRGAVERFSTDSALVLLAVLSDGGAKLVRTNTATRSLPTMLESRRISVVDSVTDRALSFDLIVHPQSISSTGFMGKAWDGSKVAYNTEMWHEALRVLKPGGHLLAFGGTRTYHRMAVAIEDAGFEIRDSLMWIYGSGFPKSHDVSKAIDRMAGAEREVKGINRNARTTVTSYKRDGRSTINALDREAITAPATPEAKQWQGWGTALKPSHEPIVMARKPLAEKSIAANVLAHGTGALNVNGCRVQHCDETDLAESERKNQHTRYKNPNSNRDSYSGEFGPRTDYNGSAGRWPPNTLLTHAPGCVPAGAKRVKSQNGGGMKRDGSDNNVYSKHTGHPKVETVGYADVDGMETVAAWECVDGCPAAALDAQSGVKPSSARPNSKGKSYEVRNIVYGDYKPRAHNSMHTDSGGASRFFPVFEPEYDVPFRYQAKASRAERNRGFEGMPEKQTNRYSPMGQGNTAQQTPRVGASETNGHPTVKPVRLMEWLVRLVTPPGGTCLDPFTGSGSTGVASVNEGFSFIGIEREPEYIEIARRRIEHAANQVRQLEMSAD